MLTFKQFLEQYISPEEALRRYNAEKKGIPFEDIVNKKSSTFKPKHTPYEWSSDGFGGLWWHEDKEWFYVNRHRFHTTEIMKNPNAFGISNITINNLLEKVAKEHKTKLSTFKREVLSGKRDILYPILELAFENGWVRAHGGSYASAETSEMTSLKAISREFIEKNPEGNLELLLVKPNSEGEYKWQKSLRPNQLRKFVER